jgi:hypothetical protein
MYEEVEDTKGAIRIQVRALSTLDPASKGNVVGINRQMTTAF